jgi:hypothetical protein
MVALLDEPDIERSTTPLACNYIRITNCSFQTSKHRKQFPSETSLRDQRLKSVLAARFSLRDTLFVQAVTVLLDKNINGFDRL